MNHNSIQKISSFDMKKERGPMIIKKYVLAFAWLTSLFFMWAIANNFNDILIKQFQKALDLTRMESGLVQTAFYFGYFTMALPAGWVMTRIGYKNGILIGLGLYAIGALLFIPASNVRVFWAFLAALYIIASGLAFLETAANPYIAAMGPRETSAQRLNFAQSFNGLGAFLAPFIGGWLIFSGVEMTPEQLTALTPDALEHYRAEEAGSVRLPYFILAVIVTLIAIGIRLTPFPSIKDELDTSVVSDSSDVSAKPTVFRHNLILAVIAQFFYVGAQVGIWSYFINFAQDLTSVGEKTAAQYLGFSLIAFMVGRFIGTGLMQFIRAERLLVIFGLGAAALCLGAVFLDGWAAVISLGLTSLFMSIMFPTIFALGIMDLGVKTKLGSSLIIMAIIGGAIFPPLMGWISDLTGSAQNGMLIPFVSFIVVIGFGLRMGVYLSKSNSGK